MHERLLLALKRHEVANTPLFVREGTKMEKELLERRLGSKIDFATVSPALLPKARNAWIKRFIKDIERDAIRDLGEDGFKALRNYQITINHENRHAAAHGGVGRFVWWEAANGDRGLAYQPENSMSVRQAIRIAKGPRHKDRSPPDNLVAVIYAFLHPDPKYKQKRSRGHGRLFL